MLGGFQALEEAIGQKVCLNPHTNPSFLCAGSFFVAPGFLVFHISDSTVNSQPLAAMVRFPFYPRLHVRVAFPPPAFAFGLICHTNGGRSRVSTSLASVAQKLAEAAAVAADDERKAKEQGAPEALAPESQQQPAKDGALDTRSEVGKNEKICPSKRGRRALRDIYTSA